MLLMVFKLIMKHICPDISVSIESMVAKHILKHICPDISATLLPRQVFALRRQIDRGAKIALPEL